MMTSSLLTLLAVIYIHTYAAELSQTCNNPGCTQQTESETRGKFDIDDATSFAQERLSSLFNRKTTLDRSSSDVFEPCKGDPSQVCTKPGTWGPAYCIAPGYPCSTDRLAFECCHYHCDKETPTPKKGHFGKFQTVQEPCTQYTCQESHIPHLKTCELKGQACQTEEGKCFEPKRYGTTASHYSNGNAFLKSIKLEGGIAKEYGFCSGSEAGSEPGSEPGSSHGADAKLAAAEAENKKLRAQLKDLEAKKGQADAAEGELGSEEQDAEPGL